MTIAQQ